MANFYGRRQASLLLMTKNISFFCCYLHTVDIYFLSNYDSASAGVGVDQNNDEYFLIE